MNNNYLSARFVIMYCFWIIVFSYTLVSELENNNFKDADYIVSKRILSIQDSNDVSGKFYIGRGTVETKTVYRFYTEDGKYLKPEEISGENIRILRDSSQDPHIEYIYKARVPKDFKDTATMDEIKENANSIASNPYRIILVVPENAVELDFTLDTH